MVAKRSGEANEIMCKSRTRGSRIQVQGTSRRRRRRTTDDGFHQARLNHQPVRPQVLQVDDEETNFDRRMEPFDQESEEIKKDIESQAFEEEEGEHVKNLCAPCRPSQEEVENHMATHVPFRSWCPHCVAGQSPARSHFRKDTGKDENQVPMVSLDYMFMSSSEKKGSGEPGSSNDHQADEKRHAYLGHE